jgi:hypothetical protein
VRGVTSKSAPGAVSSAGLGVVGGDDGKVRLLDVATGALLDEVDLAKNADRATALAFAGEETVLVGTARGVVLEVAVERR